MQAGMAVGCQAGDSACPARAQGSALASAVAYVNAAGQNNRLLGWLASRIPAFGWRVLL